MAAYQRVQYAFHPIGQGLFSSGQIILQSDKTKQFTWIYDCGTASEQYRLQDSIHLLFQQLAKAQGTREPSLDLVSISHFDSDHISGIVKILQKFTVDCLLLPYIPLEQRLAIAFLAGVDPQQSIMEFFINPVSYITRLENIDIKRIVLVPASAGAVHPEEQLELRRIDRQIPIDPWENNFGEQTRFDENERLDIDALKSVVIGRPLSVHILRIGSSIRAAEIWDFIPYNDAKVLPPLDKVFLDAVNKRRKALLRTASEINRRAALLELKELYDQHFGRKQRNLTSLFLYAVPTSSAEIKNVYVRKTDSNCTPITPKRIPFWWGRPFDRENRAGILYTGDGYLDTKDRLDRLMNYFGKDRMDRLGFLQVMHHGSEKNWHAGVARALAPDVSFFCADPDHGYGHPHGSVVRDFLAHNPVIVDKSTGVTVSMPIEHPFF